MTFDSMEETQGIFPSASRRKVINVETNDLARSRV